MVNVSRLSQNLVQAALFAGVFALFAACQSPEPVGTEGTWSVQPASSSRLTFALSDLKPPTRVRRFVSADGQFGEEIVSWTANTASEPNAGLRLSEARSGAPLSGPSSAAGIVSEWEFLADKTPTFTEKTAIENTLGPAPLWRAGVGTSVCALFLQNVASRPGWTGNLSGFYCNPPGVPLSLQDAIAAAQSVRLRSARETP